ncbi:MAG: hypothetical protein AAGG48_25905 [Planctomycetota bacterium]
MTSRFSLLRTLPPARWCAIAIMLVVGMPNSGQAHTPADFMEVLEGKPSNLVEHGIEVKDIFDSQKAEIDLEGPYHFSQAVGGMGRSAKGPKAYMSWYKIQNPKKQEPRKVVCIDFVRGDESKPLTIGSAEFFLSPAQRITSGPPSEIPVGLDLYKAYRILDEPSRDMDIELTGADSAKRRIGKPLYLCIAAEEWHHDEYTPATHRRTAFVVYEIDEKDSDAKFTLIDQFGLNQVASSKSRWLCVSASVSTKLAK